MAIWFECKIRYERITDSGPAKKVTEPYLVDALTFTEAEARIIEQMSPMISGDFSISAVRKTKISEIFFNESGDRWYLVKYNIISLDEKSGKEKKLSELILVQASDFESALNNFKEGMKGTLADFEIASINETMLMDVFPLVLGEK